MNQNRSSVLSIDAVNIGSPYKVRITNHTMTLLAEKFKSLYVSLQSVAASILKTRLFGYLINVEPFGQTTVWWKSTLANWEGPIQKTQIKITV